jgi:hypothetical protein
MITITLSYVRLIDLSVKNQNQQKIFETSKKNLKK